MEPQETIIEAAGAPASKLDLVRKLLAKAESTDSPHEAEALNERAAQLIAQYGIDRAMLAADGQGGDEIVDKVIMITRPFAEQITDLLWNIAYPLRAKGRLIKRWNPKSGPKAKGGVPRGGWDYGLRLFAYQSDLDRIEMLYVSLRNQALAGVSRITDYSTSFGQAQKAERQSYLEGFASAIFNRLARAEREAEQAREAEIQVQRDAAMLEGRSSGPSVELVLRDRRKAVEVAMDLAYGITVADRQRWAQQAEEARKQEEEAKANGTWVEPKVRRGRAYRPYERKGSHYYDGYEDGQKADLGSTATEIDQDETAEIEQ